MSAFTLIRTELETRRRELVVVSAADVDPDYRRVLLAGELDGWTSPGADDHVRLFFPVEGIPMETWPSREFTPIPVGPAVAFEFVLHDGGVASDWARAAGPGDRVVMGGPRRTMAIDGEPAWYVLLGDRTAEPAIRRFLASIPEDTPRHVVIADTPQLIEAMNALPELPGDGFVFAAAEQSVVAAARAFLESRGIPIDSAVIKGYWRRGLSADAPK
ncbi:MAG: siderophore-interacting protein [Microbacteriaceae bacterium]|nr:siderophore-interacting protein [Microbacteriaceae bacterium]